MRRPVLVVCTCALLGVTLIVSVNVKSTGGDRHREDTPQLLRLPDAQSKKLGLLMAAKNVSFALDFKQVPTTSGALFSVYAGECVARAHTCSGSLSDGHVPVLLITSVSGRVYVTHRDDTPVPYTHPLRLDDNGWHTLLIDVRVPSIVISVDCAVCSNTRAHCALCRRHIYNPLPTSTWHSCTTVSHSSSLAINWTTRIN